MREISGLYKFNELKPVSKIEALYQQREAVMEKGYVYGEESINSLMVFAEILHSELKDFSIDFYGIERSSCKFKKVFKYKNIDFEDIITTMRHHDGLFTGYYIDITLHAALEECLSDKEYNPNIILQRCFDEWLRACQEEASVYLTEDYLVQKFSHNNYLFLEDGTFFSQENNYIA